MGTIKSKLSLSVGIKGTDTDPFNPLSRGLSALLAEGRPHKAHTLCFLNPSGTQAPGKDFRWLGVFIQSDGERIVFFPGLMVPIDWIEKGERGVTSEKQTFKLDHISIEPARQRWHFTTSGSREHMPGGRTPETGQGTYFWLGLSVQSEKTFALAYRNTFVIHESPDSDAERRIRLLGDLNRFRTNGYINCDPKPGSDFGPSFLHMCFVFGLRSAPNYQGPDWLLPDGSPYLEIPLPADMPGVRVRLNRMPLVEENTHLKKV